MADELNRDAEFNSKRKDEEDPILTAQRYLNIYRQIHIFNDRRQKEFDDSLLKMPSDIRVLLSTLPGGSMLLDYITELEDKRGISLLSESEKESIKESKNKNLKGKKRDDDSSKNIKEGDTPASILRMFKHSEEKHEKDMKTLTDAFIQSQNNMANILKDVLQNKSTSSKPNENKKNKKEKSNQIEDNEWLKNEKISSTQEVDESEVNESEVNEPEVNEPEVEVQSPEEIAKAQTEALAKAAAEALIRAEAEQRQKAEASKLFSLTKRIFNSIKERRNVREGLVHNEEEDKLFNASTPASLDEIDDEPVSLDKNEVITVKAKIEEKPETVLPKQEKESPSDDDWEWEYVDDDNSEDDSEWEYIEVPEEEVQITSEAPAEPEVQPVSEPQSAETSKEPEQIYPQDIQNQMPYSDQDQNTTPYVDGQNFYYPQENYATYDSDQGWYDPNTSQQVYPNYNQVYDNNYAPEFYDPNATYTYDTPYDANQADIVPTNDLPHENTQENVDTPLQNETDTAPSDGIESSASLLARFLSAEAPNDDADENDDISSIIPSLEKAEKESTPLKPDANNEKDLSKDQTDNKKE